MGKNPHPTSKGSVLGAESAASSWPAHLNSNSLVCPTPQRGGCVVFHTAAPRWGGRFVSLVFYPKEEAMTQNELNRAVARATGEPVSLISSMGFVPLS